MYPITYGFTVPVCQAGASVVTSLAGCDRKT